MIYDALTPPPKGKPVVVRTHATVPRPSPRPSFLRADGSFDGRAAQDYYDEDFRDFEDEPC